MDAVGFALTSACLFGGMTVALRLALLRVPDAELGTQGTIVVALLVAAAASLVLPGGGERLSPRELALFALAGLLAPGLSQLFFTLAVRDAGASRASVVVGTAPLIAVVIAILVLDEPLKPALVVGAVFVVAGGIVLLGERVRPDDFRNVGIVFALVCTVLFASRDNLVRSLLGDEKLAPTRAAAATLLGGTAVTTGYRLLRRRRPFGEYRRLLPFAPAGLLFGISYVCLFEAYRRARVSVVSPLVATETFWGVLLAALLIGRREAVGKRLLAGAVLIVAGGALIGAFR